LNLNKLLHTIVLLCACSFLAIAEEEVRTVQNYAKSTHFDAKGELIFLEFTDASQYSAAQVLKLWSEIYGLNRYYTFKFHNTLADQIGMVHTRYRLYYKGVEVEGSELIMHKRDQIVVSFNGHIYKIEENQVKLTQEQAVAKALENYPSESYKWNSPMEERHLQEMENDPTATYYPKPVLVYSPLNLDYNEPKFALTYKMDVYSDAPLFRKYVYINAETGQLWAEEDRICHANANGSAVTRYSGVQKITTDSFALNSYRLRETTRGKGVETYNMQNGNKYGSAVDFTDPDNNWNNANPAQDEVATDAHWGAEKTWDYFWVIHSRNSFDGNGAKIRSYIHYGNKYNNAFWNGSVMTYGDGDSTRFYPLTCIDVCGHEVTHAVTTNSANLIYRYESGALNESFSDIFGNAIEYLARPNKADWAIGEDITPSGTGIRNMANPNAKGHPDTYKGNKWRTGAGDNGGVHSNSGVQNFWFYLLCHGGVGVNDNSLIYRVDSLGMSKAEKIAYRNLTVYLTRSSQYADARIFGIQSAQDLYGYCSKELIATTNAWYAVGVGDKYDSTELKIGFTGDTLFCHPPAKAYFSNRSVNAKNYKWYFSDGGVASVANPSHTFLQYGKFNVKLVGEGCFNGQKDSFERKAWVVVDSNFDICNAYTMPTRSWDSVYDCKGMIYDNGGESEYTTLVRDTFTVLTDPSDSIVIEFLDFDYENKYDYVYLYQGKSPKGVLLGSYTGSTLPNGGGPIVVTGGAFTIVHFSDPLVVGRGFKLKYEAFRPALSLDMPNDTAICKGSSIWIKPEVAGGYAPDYTFDWSTGERTDSIYFSTPSDTTVYLRFYDYCTDKEILDSIQITVLPDLSLSLMPDTLICHKQVVNLTATAVGGLASQQSVSWSHGQTGFSVPYSAVSDSTIVAILSDNCSSENDTAQIQIRVRDSISVTLNKDTIVCEGNTVNLKAVASGGKAPYAYFWNSGLGAGDTKAPKAYLSNTYIVTVSDGCTVPNTQDSVRVVVRQALAMTTSPDTTVCAGNQVNLRTIVVGGDTVNYRFTWSHGLSSNSNHVVLPTQSQTYRVVLNDNCSAAPISDSIMVTVLDTLSVTVTGKDTVCHGENVLLEAHPMGGQNTTYVMNWDNGLGSGSRVNTNPVKDTTYMVVLSDGCTVKPDTAYKKVVVREPLTVSVVPDAASICEGDSLLLVATGTGGLPGKYQFLWDNGLGNNKQVKVSPNFDTKYTVVLTDNCSNFVDTSVNVTIMPLPNINFEIFSTPTCVGIPITFKNNTIDKGNMELKWDFGDGTTTTVLDPEHTFKSKGFYDVKLWAKNSSGCADSMIFNGVQIEDAPVAQFSYSPLEVTLQDPEVTFTNTSSNASTYSWDFGDGGTSTDFEPIYAYQDTGNYLITLIAENAIGCKTPYYLNVFVKDIFRMYVPTAFTPNETDNLNNEFRVTANGVQEFEIKIFNRWGELVYSSEDWNESWSGKDQDGNILPLGVYFYTVKGIDVNRERFNLKGNINILR